MANDLNQCNGRAPPIQCGSVCITPAIYKIENRENGKVYVGSAKVLRKRWSEHKRTLSLGTHHNIALQRAWDKYGENAFVFSVIEHLSNQCELVEREQFWIDRLRSASAECGYNILQKAFSRLGKKHSNEAKKKMSERRIGKGLNIQLSEEHRKNISESHKGKKHSDETRKRLSEAAAMRPRGPCSEETKRKIGDANRARIPSMEARAKMSAARSGIIVSDETRAKLSAATKASWAARKSITTQQELLA